LAFCARNCLTSPIGGFTISINEQTAIGATGTAKLPAEEFSVTQLTRLTHRKLFIRRLFLQPRQPIIDPGAFRSMNGCLLGACLLSLFQAWHARPARYSRQGVLGSAHPSPGQDDDQIETERKSL